MTNVIEHCDFCGSTQDLKVTGGQGIALYSEEDMEHWYQTGEVVQDRSHYEDGSCFFICAKCDSQSEAAYEASLRDVDQRESMLAEMGI